MNEAVNASTYPEPGSKKKKKKNPSSGLKTYSRHLMDWIV